MDVQEWVETIGTAVEVVGVGVGVIVVGVALSLLAFVAVWLPKEPIDAAYRRTRRSLGRSILLGLEILVAGDIVRTVALEPSFTSVGVLAVVVGIRTFLSFTLEVEINGRWPWQQDGKDRAAAAADSG